MNQISSEQYYKPESPPQYAPESEQSSQSSEVEQSGNDKQCSTVCHELCCGGCFGCCQQQTCMRTDKEIAGNILAAFCCGTGASMAVSS